MHGRLDQYYQLRERERENKNVEIFKAMYVRLVRLHV